MNKMFKLFNLGINLILWSRFFQVGRRIVSLAFRTIEEEQHPSPSVVQKDFPMLSIIIPAWNEETVLEPTLSEIVTNNYPSWEVLIVAGGKDQSFNLAQKWANKDPRFKAILQQPRGKNAAINQGIIAAMGEMLVVLDADCLIDPECFIQLVLPLLQDYGATCANYLAMENTAVTRLFELEKIVNYGLHKQNVLHGGAIAFTRALLNQVGLMDEKVLVGVDWDYDQRLAQLGIKRKYVSKALLKTYIPSDWAEYFKNEIRWRRGHLDASLRFRHHNTLFAQLSSLTPYIVSCFLLVFPLLALPLSLKYGRRYLLNCLSLWFSVAAWVAFQPVPRVVAVLLYTRSGFWVSSFWSTPLLSLVSHLAAAYSTFTWWKKNAFFKGPRPKTSSPLIANPSLMSKVSGTAQVSSVKNIGN